MRRFAIIAQPCRIAIGRGPKCEAAARHAQGVPPSPAESVPVPDAADEVTIATHSHQKKWKREETVGRKFAIILFILKLINVFSSIFQLSVHLLRVLNTYQILTGSTRPKSNRSDIGITR